MDADFFFTGLVEPFHFDPSLLSTWKSPPDCFLTSLSHNSIHLPCTNFESSLTSTVIQDRVGQHSTVCNSDDISPPQSHPAVTQHLGDNATTSCYMSLLNPSLNLQLPVMNQLVNLINTPPPVNPLPSLSRADHRLEEESAKFSSVGSLSFNAEGIQKHIELHHTSGTLISDVKLTSSNEEPSVSEQISLGEGEVRIPNDLKSRKRLSRPKGKKPMDIGAHLSSNAYKMEDENGEPNAKRSRLIKVENDENHENIKPIEPPKDYIHVRARRGQATDSHSLAERVRREKISERMKLLENLVPGCNKVTGKALMLDEIINYVQSLQRQVEFLSMKLATVNHTRLDFNFDSSFFKKDMFQPSSDYLKAALFHPFDCNEIDDQGQLHCGLVDPMASISLNTTFDEFWPRSSFEGN